MVTSARSWRRWVRAGEGVGPASVGLALVMALLLPVAFGGVAGAGAAASTINFVQVVAVVLAGLFVVRVARLRMLVPGQRRAFRLLAFAVLVLAAGDVAWAWVDAVRRQDPSASSVNWIYLPFYPLMLAGVLAFPRIFRSR